MPEQPVDPALQSKHWQCWPVRRLVFPDPGIATFARQRFSLVLPVAFGLAMLIAAPLFVLHDGPSGFGWNSLPFVIFFVLADLAGVTGLIVTVTRTRPLVFDKHRGQLYRPGRPDPRIGDYAKLSGIEALKAISGTIRSGSNSWRVHELSVLMTRAAGAGVPVVCHSNREALLADARQLAAFLGVPLLDHTSDAPKRSRRKTA